MNDDDPPLQPGAVLRGRVFAPPGIAAARAARDLGVTRRAPHRLLSGEAGATPAMAARVGRSAGTGSARWLGPRRRNRGSTEAGRALGGAPGRILLARAAPAAARLAGPGAAGGGTTDDGC